MNTPRQTAQRGAALISAMLVVSLVATLASAALWQQWRHVEVESAERHRVQSSWLLNGAFDWTRLILREDAMAGVAGATLTSGSGQMSATGGIDHLGEPWALPLKEAKLSTFLAQDQQMREGDPEVFLSGQVTDAQGRINLSNWVEVSGGSGPARLSLSMQLSMGRLFDVLGLPSAELDALAREWLAASQNPRPAGASLRPQQVTQLQWLGLSPASLQRLQPHLSILPEATPLNLNTASAEVIYAALPGLSLSAAQQFVQYRAKTPLTNLSDAAQALGLKTLASSQFALGSRYFEVWGRLRMEDRIQEETALILRDAGNTRFVWRQKIAGIRPPPNQESLLQSSQP